jgi:hypothetical protein
MKMMKMVMHIFFWAYAVYEGECKRFIKDGKGKYRFVSGSVYEGDWKDGKQHGMGTFIFSGGDGE